MSHRAASTALSAALIAVAVPSLARASVVDVVPTDSPQTNIAKIEGAGPGDEVVVHPGTYAFRLYLEGRGTADKPIVIRAADPQNRPVWDLAGGVTASFPGSYTGGDAGRGIWQITGSYYTISDVVLTNGTDGQANGSGMRLKSSDHVTIRSSLFRHNDNGIQGAGTSTLVESCELAENGDPALTEGSHNLYIHGGTITVRYSYIHDATQGQNFHVRANDAVLEYNWIARSTRYMGDMMPCTVGPCDPLQHLLLRGNVFIRGTPTNDGQELVLYNDQATPNMGFELTMVSNTFIGNGDGAPLVHLANDTGDIQSEKAVLDDNAIVSMGSVFKVDNPGLTNVAPSGTHNFLTTGTSGASGLTATVTGADPGFTDAAHAGFVPAAGSPLIGAADGTVPNLPDKEYYRDEKLPMMWRDRLTVRDIGAFESTTQGTAGGPDGQAPGGAGGAIGAGGTVGAGGAIGTGGAVGAGGAIGTGGAAGGSATPAGAVDSGSGGGCGCAERPGPVPGWWIGVAALVLLRRRTPSPSHLAHELE